jgi:hypothetical protein
MQNPKSNNSRTRRYTWSWRSLTERASDPLDTEEPSLSLEELMALTSDQSIRAQRDYRINATRPTRG